MKLSMEIIGALVLLLASVLASIVFFDYEIMGWLHGPPPSNEQVRQDFLQALEIPSSTQKIEVQIRRIGIAEHEGKWIRMYTNFDATAQIDATIKVGKRSILIKGRVASVGGEASLEYTLDGGSTWKLVYLSLDREPRPND